MRSIQEQEDMDYQIGAASEACNAYALSSMTREPDDRIARALKRGDFVVVTVFPEYCRYTDGLLTSRPQFVSSHYTRKGAETAMGRIDHQEYDDATYFVLPVAPTPRSPYVPTDPDSVPF